MWLISLVLSVCRKTVEAYVLLSAHSFIMSLSCNHSAVSFLVAPPGGAKVERFQIDISVLSICH